MKRVGIRIASFGTETVAHADAKEIKLARLLKRSMVMSFIHLMDVDCVEIVKI